MTTNNINIPNGWNIKRINELGKVITGSTPSMACPENYGGNFCWATAQDFQSKYISNTVIKLTKKGKSISRVLPAGSVLITCIASIGLNAITKVEMATNQQINAIVVNEENNNEFIYYLISHNTKYLKRFAGAGGMLILSKGVFEKLRFMIPPLPEQEKIAEILSCWDEAIEKLSDLIEQKKFLKKGLMQKLLTGKTRLSGFTQPWKEVKLGEIAEFILGYSFDSNDFKENGIPLIRISNIEDDKLSLDKDTVFLDTSSLQKYQKYCIKQQDLLIAMSGATTGKMGINKTVTPMLLNQRVGIIRAKKSNQCFINQYLMRFNNKILRMSYGGAQPNIGSNDIKKIKLFIPSDISEQQAIADVLSTADDEIEKLQHKLNLLKLQKKGLMQQLLTGKIRVKVNK